MMRKILIVDDDRMECAIAEKVLSKYYETACAGSGEAALEMLDTYRPALVLTDLNMPGMDGYELIVEIKEKCGDDIPVIFLTSEDDSAHEVKGLELGARDYLHKPIMPNLMLERIAAVLKNEEARKKLEKDADTDQLTGLLNRRAAVIRIDSALKESGENGVLLMMDIDHFKKVNDTFGHVIGDKLIMNTAEALKPFVRSTDILARLGGDEFIIYYRNHQEPALLEDKCRKINERMKYVFNDMLVNLSELSLSFSIGIACAPENGNDFASLYHNADMALYNVKENGRCGFSFFSDIHGENAPAENNGLNSGSEDAARLNDILGEDTIDRGAYSVDYDEFRNIYRFLQRRKERAGSEDQFVMLTLHNDSMPVRGAGNLAEYLGNVVQSTLRRADVMVRYGQNRYLVLLTGTNSANGNIAVKRIMERWKSSDDICGSCSIDYEMYRVSAAL